MEPELHSPATSPPPEGSREPRIIPRSEHPISRRDFDREALWVLQRLRHHGYKAYLVGGAVRDLLLGKPPKDYDVATDARPSRLKKIFRNCRIIGRRFRIAHVFFPSGMIIEVATFRQSSTKNVRGESGIILRDNVYGSPEEDACRRDLTINGLFYDIETFSIIDYVGGVEDLRNRSIRMINEPRGSIREDPVRMIRALRHAARTDFRIEEDTLKAIYECAPQILECNPSRLLEELFKDLRSGASLPHCRSMLEMGILEALLPELARQLIERGEEHPLWSRLAALDRLTRSGESYPNPVLLAVLLHTLLLREENWLGERSNPPNAWGVISQALRALPDSIRISRRDAERVTQILIAFRKLRQCVEHGKLTPALARKNYILDALDYLRIAEEARGAPTDLVAEWRASLTPPEPAEGEGPDAGPAPGTDTGETGGRGEQDGTEGGTSSRRKRRRRSKRRRRKRPND